MRTSRIAAVGGIWSDFEGRILSQPRMDEHLQPGRTGVTFLQIRAMRPPAQGEEPQQAR